jgi:hypothetical protein
MAEPTWCCVEPGGYCAGVDTMFNMPSVHVLDAAWRDHSRKGGGWALFDGGIAPGRDRLPGLRGDRGRAWPAAAAAA